MEKRNRLEKVLAGELPDRLPVALWRHWPGDDQRAADLARSTLDFQRDYDWDFVKVTPASSYCVADYGVQTAWQGDVGGNRTPIKQVVGRSLQWTELRTPDPLRGELGKHIEALNLLCDGLRDEAVPVITTIYSPLTQAAMIAEDNLMLRHMRTEPERLRSGLNTITEGLLRLIDALKRTEIAGIFYVLDQADYEIMSEDEYRVFGQPFDLKIFNMLPSKWWLNMLHLPGRTPMFELAATYRVQAICWDSHVAAPELGEARSLFRGGLCSGLSAEQHLHRGTPAIVRDIARDAISRVGDQQLILSAGEAVPVSAPLSNLRAVREVVEMTKRV